MKTSATIVGDGPDLAADLYLPNDPSGPVPAVITGSGFGGVKEMLLPVFAEALAEAGIATLCIDYAGFGASGGAPRQQLDPRKQVEDLRRGLDYLSTRLDIDPSRLGAWGPSMCGAHTLVLAGTDPRVRAAVSIIPFVKAPLAPSSRVIKALVTDAVRRAFGGQTGMIAVSGGPDDVACMNTDGALEWIREVSRAAPLFRNEVTLDSLVKVANYRPMRWVGRAGIKVPLRTILATGDTVTPAASARAALARVTHNDIIEFAGTHFELFGAHLPEVVRLTVEWFTRHLVASRQSDGERKGASRAQRAAL